MRTPVQKNVQSQQLLVKQKWQNLSNFTIFESLIYSLQSWNFQFSIPGGSDWPTTGGETANLPTLPRPRFNCTAVQKEQEARPWYAAIHALPGWQGSLPTSWGAPGLHVRGRLLLDRIERLALPKGESLNAIRAPRRRSRRASRYSSPPKESPPIHSAVSVPPALRRFTGAGG